jgi:hypothetical protein
MKKHDPVDGFTALMLAERVVAAAMGKTTCHLIQFNHNFVNLTCFIFLEGTGESGRRETKGYGRRVDMQHVLRASGGR